MNMKEFEGTPTTPSPESKAKHDAYVLAMHRASTMTLWNLMIFMVIIFACVLICAIGLSNLYLWGIAFAMLVVGAWTRWHWHNSLVIYRNWPKE